MDDQRIYVEKLVVKLYDGEITEVELEELITWYNGHNDEYLELEQTETNTYEQVRERMLKKLLAQVRKNESLKRRSIVLRKKVRIAVAASFILTFLLGSWYFLMDGFRNPRSPSIQVDNFQPGSNRAVLTLADGSTIELSELHQGIVVDENDGVAYTDGTSVLESTRVASSHHLTVATPRGGQYQVQLPDGTQVWLNATSSIVYPTSFAGMKERRVKISGEAYLEVAHDRSHPFLVEMASQTVEVLGTRFLVNDYEDEPSVLTTLMEGSVRVTPHKAISPRVLVLKPNEQSSLDNTGLNKSNVDASAFIDWKEGEFIFQEESVASIMRKLSRWYDFQVIFMHEAPKEFTFSGSISRFDKVATVLDMLEETGDVHFEVSDRSIRVFKK